MEPWEQVIAAATPDQIERFGLDSQAETLDPSAQQRWFAEQNTATTGLELPNGIPPSVTTDSENTQTEVPAVVPNPGPPSNSPTVSISREDLPLPAFPPPQSNSPFRPSPAQLPPSAKTSILPDQHTVALPKPTANDEAPEVQVTRDPAQATPVPERRLIPEFPAPAGGAAILEGRTRMAPPDALAGHTPVAAVRPPSIRTDPGGLAGQDPRPDIQGAAAVPAYQNMGDTKPPRDASPGSRVARSSRPPTPPKSKGRPETLLPRNKEPVQGRTAELPAVSRPPTAAPANRRRRPPAPSSTAAPKKPGRKADPRPPSIEDKTKPPKRQPPMPAETAPLPEQIAHAETGAASPASQSGLTPDRSGANRAPATSQPSTPAAGPTGPDLAGRKAAPKSPHPVPDNVPVSSHGVGQPSPTRIVPAPHKPRQEETKELLVPEDLAESAKVTHSSETDKHSTRGENADATEDDLTFEVTLASDGRRGLAAMIDVLVVLMLVQGMAMLGVFGERFATLPSLDPDDLARTILDGSITLPAITFMLLFIGWSTASHTIVGRSIGKAMVRLQVIDRRTGERPGLPQAFLRSVMTLLGAACGGVGVLWLLVDRDRSALHDRVCKTHVIRDI